MNDWSIVGETFIGFWQGAWYALPDICAALVIFLSICSIVIVIMGIVFACELIWRLIINDFD